MLNLITIDLLSILLQGTHDTESNIVHIRAPLSFHSIEMGRSVCCLIKGLEKGWHTTALALQQPIYNELHNQFGKEQIH